MTLLVDLLLSHYYGHIIQSVYYSGYDINQNSFKLPNISTRSSLETGRGVLDPINSLELKNSWLSMLATSALPAYTFFF